MYFLRRILMLLAVAMAVSVSAHTATDIYMQIEGIPGEATDGAHTDWIDVLSIAHSVKQSVSHDDASAGGRVAQRAHLGDFHVSKILDKSSVNLTQACNKGDPLPTVIIELVQTSGARATYMKYELTNVLVTSINTFVSEGDVRPTEEIALTYQKITWTYTKLDPSTGDPTEDTQTGGWDRDTNRETAP